MQVLETVPTLKFSSSSPMDFQHLDIRYKGEDLVTNSCFFVKIFERFCRMNLFQIAFWRKSCLWHWLGCGGSQVCEAKEKTFWEMRCANYRVDKWGKEIQH